MHALAAAARRRPLNEFRRLVSAAASTSTTTMPSSPPPIRVGFTPSAGRGVFATRAIAAGEVLHTARPLITHPSMSNQGNVCYNCLRQLGEREVFCGDDCRGYAKAFYEVEKSVNWNIFDDHCRLLGVRYPFMVKRLACMVVSGTLAFDSLDILQPAKLPAGVLIQMEEGYKLLENCFRNAKIHDKLLAFFHKQWYVNALARMRLNAFRIELVSTAHDDLMAAAVSLISTDASIGSAIYMVPSFYNHDCDPNAHILWLDNADAKLKSLRDIEAGEELRICYIDASMDHNARQRILLEGFGFLCSCPRCLSKD